MYLYINFLTGFNYWIFIINTTYRFKILLNYLTKKALNKLAFIHFFKKII